jgi:hypothetical protein
MLLTQLDSPRDRNTFSVQNFEEMSEISLQLGMIRKKYDILKQDNAHKRKTLKKITKDVEQLGLLTAVHSGDQFVVENNYYNIQSNLEIHKKYLKKRFLMKKLINTFMIE